MQFDPPLITVSSPLVFVCFIAISNGSCTNNYRCHLDFRFIHDGFCIHETIIFSIVYGLLVLEFWVFVFGFRYLRAVVYRSCLEIKAVRPLIMADGGN